MARILDQRTALEKTVRIFDSFYEFDLVVNTNEFDIVNGYFASINPSKNISGNFTAVLFRIAQETKIPPLTLLDYLKGANGLEMNKIMAYYLNSFKSKTTLYGIAVVPQANLPVARNIVS